MFWLDTFISDKIEAAYLYLWDLVGITIGNVLNCITFAYICGIILISGRSIHIMTWVMLVLSLVVNQFFHYMQAKGKFTWWNAMAIHSRTMLIPTVFRWHLLLICLFPLPWVNAFAYALTVLNGLSLFFLCVRLRERDPDRFKKVKFAFNPT